MCDNNTESEKQKTLEVYNVIFQGMMGVDWIFKCECDKDFQKQSVGKALEEFKRQNEGISPFNIGVLMMASYLFFVYPKESALLDISEIVEEIEEVKKFDIIQPKNKKADQKKFAVYILRRIRNSISHSNFKFDKEYIIFKDQSPCKNNDIFEAKIKIGDFGNFI